MDLEDPGILARRWRDALDDWRIPADILAAAPESPWVLPTQMFVGRARREVGGPTGFSAGVAAEALPETGLPDGGGQHAGGGRTVLDVGAGAGAASLGLRDRVAEIVAVDESASMLARFAEIAAEARVPARTVLGRWPDVARGVPVADVVVCSHVLFNVPDIVPFVDALTAHARRRVVVEISANHPATMLNPLWTSLHGIDRPEGPTAAEAIEVIGALGLAPRWHAWERPITVDGTSWDELVASTGKRLCLGPERAPDVAAALRDLGVTRDAPHLGGPTRSVVTIWWDGRVTAPGR